MSLLWLVPALPLMAGAVIAVAGRRLPHGGSELAILAPALSLLVLLLLSGEQAAIGGPWYSVGGLTLSVGLQLDGLSRLMAIVVAGISLVVTIYATVDVERDPPRFFAELSCFIGAMLCLVLANSLLLMFMAWEAVGVASYLLIGFKYQEKGTPGAALRAFLITRLADLGFFFGWLWAWRLVGSNDIGTLLLAVRHAAIPASTVSALAVLFMLAALGKSAQLPFSLWLPDAMVAPTPVSALLHSATMVAAGVFLIVRLYPLFAASPGVLGALAWIGAITAVCSGLLATAQADLKRILAWSTIEQLGEMMLALGLGGPLAAAYHLTTHAAFKATLFLSAGAILHVTGARNLDRMGGLWRPMGISAVCFGAAALALAGFPPFSGYWSEDVIVRQAVTAGGGWGTLVLGLMLLAGLYIARAAVSAFGPHAGASPHVPAAPPRMQAAMVLLALAAVGLGGALHARLGPMLGLPEPQAAGTGWTIAGMLTGACGLALGTLLTRARGAKPMLGAWPLGLERLLASATRMTGEGMLAIARMLDGVERGIDAVTGALASLALQTARGSAKLEDAGISGPLDVLATGIRGLGVRLSQVQSGRIYAYTAVFFAWVLLVVTGVWLWN